MTSVAHEARASMAAHQNIGRVTKTDALCTKNVTTSTRGHGTCTDNEIGYRMLINDTIIDKLQKYHQFRVYAKIYFFMDFKTFTIITSAPKGFRLYQQLCVRESKGIFIMIGFLALLSIIEQLHILVIDKNNNLNQNVTLPRRRRRKHTLL